MRKNTAALVKSASQIEAPALDARNNRRREAYEGAATRQLHFVYRTPHPVDETGPVTAGLLQRWLQDRSSSMVTARPMLGFRVTAGVLTKIDRFFVGYAVSALGGLQSKGFEGRVVITLTTAGLTDPLLPLYVVSQLRRRGVSSVGVKVTLAP